MNFQMQIMAREIAQAISLCAQVVDAGSKIPILRCTRIEVADGMASFMATNTDQTVVAKAACEGAGVICVDTQALDAKVKTLKLDAIVNFAGTEKSVVITQGRTRWVAPVLIDDMPAYREIDAPSVRVDAGFIKGVEQCKPAADLLGGGREYLQGVYLDKDRIVATDGRQLRIVQHGADIVGRILVPSRAADHITGMFPDGAELRCSEHAASFANDHLTLWTKLIDATFPDYRRVVPTNSKGLVQVGAQELLQAITRAAAIRATGEKSGSFINMQLRIRESEIEVFTRNTDGEEGSDFAPCERVSGGDIDIGFSGAWLIASVKSLDCDNIEILYGGQGDPVVMRPINSAMENIRVVMPRMFS